MSLPHGRKYLISYGLALPSGRKQLEGMILVREIMKRDVKTVGLDATLKEAVAKMNRFSIGSLVVVSDRKPIGIVTERDILRVVEQDLDVSSVKVKEAMSHPLVTITEETNSMDAAEIMVKKQVKRLPVVKHGELVGILTTMELVRSRPTLMRTLDAILKD
jgi:CBS domain-containing protein